MQACVQNPAPLDFVDRWGKRRSFDYSAIACFNRQLQLKLAAKCSCTSEAIPVPWELNSVAQCHQLMKDRETTRNRQRCHKLWVSKEKRRKLHAQCPFRCDNRVYSFTTNYIVNFELPKYRVDDYHLSILIDLLRQFGETAGVTQVLSLFEEIEEGQPPVAVTGAVCALELSPQLNHVQVVQEELAYPKEKFVSEIGGILGLWLGFSLITIVEVLELLLRAPILFFCLMRDRTITPKAAPLPEDNSGTVQTENCRVD